MEFGQKKFVNLIYLISRVFLDWTFFKNFLADCVGVFLGSLWSAGVHIYFTQQAFLSDALILIIDLVTNAKITWRILFHFCTIWLNIAPLIHQEYKDTLTLLFFLEWHRKAPQLVELWWNLPHLKLKKLDSIRLYKK